MTYNDDQNLELLFATTKGLPFNPPTYTCIKEFTDSFPQRTAPPFMSDPQMSKPAYIPEDPYPRIYTKDYKKTLLTILK